MAKATNRKAKQSNAHAEHESHTAGGMKRRLRLYWPHLFMASFGAFLALLGTGAIGQAIEYALIDDYPLDAIQSAFYWGVGLLAFGGMIIGAAIAKGAHMYHKRHDIAARAK